MTTLKHIWTTLKYSLPVRLVARQLRRHKALLLFWVLLLGFLSGQIGESLGAAHLFLSPEYLGKEDFWSVFITGSALGAFIFAYSITLYINESHRFHFIALTRHPFYTLAYNNFVIPGFFFAWYLYKFAGYHLAEGWSWAAVEKITGLLTGIIVVFLISATYFFAERSIINRFGQRLQKGLAKAQGKQQRKALILQAREGLKSRQITDYYISFPFRIHTVDTAQHEKLREIVGRLAQQHGKLLLLQIVTFLLIAGLGLLENYYAFQIPAGASFLLMFSLGIMMMGAISFWFRKFGLVTALVVVGVFWMYNQSDLFREKHHAFGLDYQKAPVAYHEETLSQFRSDSLYQADRDQTIASLEAWKNRYQAEYGHHQKPRAVFVTASGGGLRSALWTFNALQTLDSISDGRMTDEIRLMTGASGGMFGESYFRELMYRRHMGEDISFQDGRYLDNISQDLLNRLVFKMFTDLILPSRKVEVNGHKYDWETGYSFEHQVGLNLPEFEGRLMTDYAQAEARGLIPQVIMTPTIINQTRQLFISASPASYLARPDHISDGFHTRSRGVEFQRFFADHGAENLRLTTALRMNASFPVFMPVVQLPTTPAMDIMDAGAIDNYGTVTLARYLSEFKEWFEENTSGIVLVLIRDNDRIDPIRTGAQSRLGRLAMPLGEGYNSAVEAKDMSGEYMLKIIGEWYDGPMEVVALEYPRETSEDPASLSWHLTKREKRNILQSIHTRTNQEALQRVREMYGLELLAKK